MKYTKNNVLILSVFAITSALSSVMYAGNGITYSFSGGRLGDNLVTYVEARWLAYKTGLEFYYRPFKYSDLLAMHTMHTNYRDHDKLRIVSVEDVEKFVQKTDTLYVISCFPFNNHVDWNDPIFYQMMKEEISPLIKVPKLEVPEGDLNVGIHVRRGGGWDYQLKQSGTLITASSKTDVFADVEYPTRFAPDSYFIEQLRYLLKRFPDRKMLVNIFTDDPRPDLIAEKYKLEIANPRITFNYRMEGNKHDANVLEDLFMMSQCEVLIRPGSNFSAMAGRLGRVKLEISPNDCAWENDDILWITQVLVVERSQEWETTWYMLPAGPEKSSKLVRC